MIEESDLLRCQIRFGAMCNLHILKVGKEDIVRGVMAYKGGMTLFENLN